MAEGEVEKSEGMLATASLHHTSVVKREHDQVSLNNQVRLSYYFSFYSFIARKIIINSLRKLS
ncbi:hypothetical protein O3M35_012619 [Rhynocoris fuscipes]|uniref:Uncharacterized protein n=1 Tax=Rhynocoris fuscipes TaxID=488301 RepID=A0AAW1D0Y6_9HEMI